MILPLLTLKDFEKEMLFQKSKSITKVEKNLKGLIDDMAETMYFEKGIGLSAVQVKILKNLFVMDIPQVTSGVEVFINPTIKKFSKDFNTDEEGCLSIPDIRIPITRPKSVVLGYYDENLNYQEITADGIKATCIQHEMDHLSGILILSRVSPKSSKKVMELLKDNDYEIASSLIGNLAYSV